MEVRKGKLISETDHLKLYATNDPEKLIIRYKDEIAGKNKKDPVRIKHKGEYDSAIAAILFAYLESYHIPTHFCETNKAAEIIVMPSDPIPIGVHIWNFADEALHRRYGLKKGNPLHCSIVEFVYRNRKLKHPIIHFDHACALELVTLEEIQRIDQLSRKANAVLKSFFDRRDLKLIYFTLQFARAGDQIILAGDLSPNTMQLWDIGNTAGTPQEIPEENASAYQRLKEMICK